VSGHTIYVGKKLAGGSPRPFGRCSCGLYLEDQAAIDKHREETA
jgi:hypothetical protein